MNEYVAACRILERVISEQAHLDDAITPGTSPLVQQICYGALRHFELYDALISRLLEKPLAAKHLDLKMILLAALYSLDHLKRPAHASVNHAVDAAAGVNKKWARGLINAVLRRYGREQSRLVQQLQTDAPDIGLCHPGWLIRRIRADWPDRDDIFLSNNQQAPMTLRVNQQRGSRQAYLDRLEIAGINGVAGELTESAILLEKGHPVDTLPGFATGDVSVQDEAPQLAPGFMNLAAGQQVLDACAAPGGKTCHLLESAPGIDLTAIDRDRKRIDRISDNLARLGMTAHVVAADLQSFSPAGLFDRVLLDAPCSATGIIRRHPDIKLLRSNSDIDKLSALQRVLLGKAFELLKPGGELLYATCSILRQENDQVVSHLLSERPDARSRVLGFQPTGDHIVQTPLGLQLLPTPTSHDGFYYAAVSKTAL